MTTPCRSMAIRLSDTQRVELLSALLEDLLEVIPPDKRDVLLKEHERRKHEQLAQTSTLRFSSFF